MSPTDWSSQNKGLSPSSDRAMFPEIPGDELHPPHQTGTFRAGSFPPQTGAPR